MKGKKIRIICLLAFVILACFTICSCSSKALSKQEEQAIVETYILEYNEQAEVDSVVVEHFFGRFNNALVVLMKDEMRGDTGVMTDREVAGVTFTYPYSNREITVFINNAFVTLQQAYEDGLLSKDNLEKIATELAKIYK